MATPRGKLVVFYDAACPRCRADRERYLKLAGPHQARQVSWIDINGREAELQERGIDPVRALTELHVMDDRGGIHAELDAYILLMSRVPLLKPLAWLIGLPGIRSAVAFCYHRSVKRRLQRQGRYPGEP